MMFQTPLYENVWYLSTYFVVSCIQMLTMTAQIFGYSSLLVVLKKEGFYSRLCPQTMFNVNISHNGSFTMPKGLYMSCVEQDKQLNIVYICGSIALLLNKYPCGQCVDILGAKCSQVIAVLFNLFSGLLMAFTTPGSEVFLIIALLAQTISASLTFLSTAQVTNVVFLKYKALFLCIVSGCIDSAAVVYLVFMLAYQAGYTYRNICLAYTISTTLLLLFSTLVLCPSKDEMSEIMDEKMKLTMQTEKIGDSCEKQTRGYSILEDEENFLRSNEISYYMSISINGEAGAIGNSLGTSVLMDGERQPLLKKNVVSKTEDTFENKVVSKRKNVCCLVGCLPSVQGPSLTQSMKSPLYIFSLFGMCAMSLRMIYFVGTINKQLRFITDSDSETVEYYLILFGFIQICGAFIPPFIGIVFSWKEVCKQTGLEKMSPERFHLDAIKSCIVPGFIVCSIGVLFSSIILIESLKCMIPAFILYAFANGFMWGYYTAYYGIAFPPQHYSSLYALTIVCSGVVCCLQYPFLILTNNVFDGRLLPTNAILAALSVTTFFVPVYLVYYCRKLAHNISTEEEKHSPAA